MIPNVTNTMQIYNCRARRLVVAALLVFALIPILCCDSLQALTIDQAVEMALQRNEDYLLARSQLSKAEAEVQSATSEALPQISLTSAYNRNLVIPTAVFEGMRFKLGTDNQIDVGVSVTQSLWHGGKVVAAIKIARLYREYTRYGVEQAGSDISFGVRQAYLAAILAQNLVDVYRDALEAAKLNYEMVKKMEEQGVKSEFELLRARVEVSNLQPQLTQAQNQARVAANRLKNLINVNLSDSLELSYDFDESLMQYPLELSRLIGLAMENRAELQQQDVLREITRRAIGVIDADNAFKLDLQSQYGWQYQADNFDLGESNLWSESWSAGIIFSWPIFDGFRNKAEVRKAKVDHNNAELVFQQLTDEVEADVREALFLYQEAGERLQAQETTIAEAEEGLRIAQLRYSNGVGTQLEILSAESALTQARNNYVQAGHDAALAVYRLLNVTGVDDFTELLSESTN